MENLLFNVENPAYFIELTLMHCIVQWATLCFKCTSVSAIDLILASFIPFFFALFFFWNFFSLLCFNQKICISEFIDYTFNIWCWCNVVVCVFYNITIDDFPKDNIVFYPMSVFEFNLMLLELSIVFVWVL